MAKMKIKKINNFPYYLVVKMLSSEKCNGEYG